MRRLLVILLPLCLLACSDGASEQGGSILPPDVQFRVGDVVFRRGSGFTSHAVLLAEKGGVYSHVGIVVDSAGVPMIVHAVPGEPDYEGDDDRVKMESPEAFFACARAQQGAVYRHIDSMTAHRAADVALSVYRRHTLFDHDYDDSDTTSMYCTELVVHAYAATSRPLPGLQHHHLRLIGIETDCILPSDILHCSDLKPIINF